MGIDLAARQVTTYREAVAAELRAALARRGLSGSALARATGRPQTWVSARTRGAVPLDTNDLELIADVLGIDPVELLPRGWVKPSPVPPAGGDSGWAPWESNPQPADYKYGSSSRAVTLRREQLVPPTRLPRHPGLPPQMPRTEAA